ncbi:hypothetical protein Trydic_g16230 [Trypoxylus dichotomus]
MLGIFSIGKNGCDYSEKVGKHVTNDNLMQVFDTKIHQRCVEQTLSMCKMAIAFWNKDDVLLVELMLQIATINSGSYPET